MVGVIIHKTMTLDEKAARMQEDARFDVADENDPDLDTAAGIRQSVRSAKSPPKVPKVFLSNDCVFNCAYCGCRQSHDCTRYATAPNELAELAVREARLYRRGIFLTSAIVRSPDYTEELIIRTLKIIRSRLGYTGYVHAKVMPGADPALIHEAGLYADRLSVNIEVARSEGYAMIARNKNKRAILTPMGQISDMIRQAKADQGRWRPRFATSQTTQLMAGSTNEDDFTILNLSGALYRKYGLSRVYYTAFQYKHRAAGYENLPPVATPAWRMRRLYQADRLMQLYGFTAEEIAPPSARRLAETLDPKAAWALRNLHLFPVEVNRADQEMLLRVPGIGLTYAERIVRARRACVVTHDVLGALGISQKRCRHFITCDGKYAGDTLENIEALAGYLAERPDGREGTGVC